MLASLMPRSDIRTKNKLTDVFTIYAFSLKKKKTGWHNFDKGKKSIKNTETQFNELTNYFH